MGGLTPNSLQRDHQQCDISFGGLRLDFDRLGVAGLWNPAQRPNCCIMLYDLNYMNRSLHAILLPLIKHLRIRKSIETI
jgi:hypothetical protein